MSGTERRILMPDDVAKLKRVAAPRISPDGEIVVFTVTEADVPANRKLTSLWAVPWLGGEAEQIIAPTPVLALPEWSHDGSRLAFMADLNGSAELWVLDWSTREIRHIAIAAPGHGPLLTDDFYAALEWSPDDSHLCFVAQATSDPEDPFLWRQWQRTEAYADLKRRAHVWTVPAAGGPALQITAGDYHHAQPRWSPDGRSIVFVSNRSGREEAVKFSINQNYSIWRVPAAGGDPVQLTTHDGPNVGPCWSPDGERLAYTWTRAHGTETDVFALRVLALQSGKHFDVTTPAAFDHAIARLEPGNWRNGSFYFSAEVHGQMLLMTVPDSGGSPRRLSPERCCATVPRSSAGGGRIAFVLESPNQPPEVWGCAADGSGLHRLTFTNPAVEEAAVHQAQVIRWRAYDDREIEGFLIRPSGVSGPGPLIVYPHGGPHSANFLNFNLDCQAYAGLGYSVFLPNIRGSSGYGQAFIDADRGDYGGADYQDMMAGVDHLISSGVADPERLFLLGGSYGGFMTCWAVGHTNRFRAAVASCSITDLYSFYGQTEIPSWIEWSFGLPWENADLLRAHSPITHAHRVQTPILLTHGENDLRVPLAQSLEFYRILEKIGVECAMIVYPGEGHPILKPQHAVDLLRRKIDWLARHGGIPVPQTAASA